MDAGYKFEGMELEGADLEALCCQEILPLFSDVSFLDLVARRLGTWESFRRCDRLLGTLAHGQTATVN